MPKVIVSVTSFGKKMNNLLPKVMYLLLNKQTFKELKVCLTLNKEDYEMLSNELIKLLIETNTIDLIIAEKHLKPHLKYFYAMQKYKDLPIITVDDDTILPDTAIEELYNTYLKYPNCICGRQVCELRKSNLPIIGSRNVVNDEPPNHKFLAEGFCGILYPPNCFGEFYNDVEELKKIEDLVTDDDIYLKGLEIRKGIKVKKAILSSKIHLGQMDLGNEYEKFSLHTQFNSNSNRAKNMQKITKELNSIGVQ